MFIPLFMGFQKHPNWWLALGISSIDGMNQTISTLEPQAFRISTSENRENFNLRWSEKFKSPQKATGTMGPTKRSKAGKSSTQNIPQHGDMLVPQEKLYFTLLRLKSFKKYWIQVGVCFFSAHLDHPRPGDKTGQNVGCEFSSIQRDRGRNIQRFYS